MINSTNLKSPEEILKHFFGYDEFRVGQKELISNIINGNDVLGIMPTSAGKSLCYQIPAMVLDGIAIIISPLISLMKDQVDGLKGVGIKAAFLNSTLTYKQQKMVIDNCLNNMYKILYVAPERFEEPNFAEFLKKAEISFIAVDEAHCVSHWGHDFRPSYVNIKLIINNLNRNIVLAAFTATATPIVREDIVKMLGLKQPFIKVTGFDRENLYFSVEKPVRKYDCLIEKLKIAKDSPVIVYASTRKIVESTYKKLVKAGYKVTKYHAGLTDIERRQNQEDFIFDKCNIIIATNAFGMGIDKSNVRYVIHLNMPKDIESYYQEAGRGGRDGENSQCILLFSNADVITGRLFIDNGENTYNRAELYTKINQMVDYCNTSKCLRGYILNYFGYTKMENCGNCSNCNGVNETTDITIEAQKIISCVIRTKERFGQSMISQILNGTENKKIIDMNLTKESTFGIMKDYSLVNIRKIIGFLIAEGYLITSGDKYPIIKITDNSVDILKNGVKVVINELIEEVNEEEETEKRKISKKEKSSKRSKREKNSTKTSGNDDLFKNNGLFEDLRTLRKEISTTEKIPPYIIFSDKTLIEFCKHKPKNIQEFLLINGVGDVKAEKYGEIFIKRINNYNNINL